MVGNMAFYRVVTGRCKVWIIDQLTISCFPSYSSINVFDNDISRWLTIMTRSSVIRQKGESQNGSFKKTKHAKFSEKRTFFTPWYAHVIIFYFMEVIQIVTFFPLTANKMHWWNIFYFVEVTVWPLDFSSLWKKYSSLWHRSLRIEIA